MPSGGKCLMLGDKCKDCSTVLTDYNKVVKKGRLGPYCKECEKVRYKTYFSQTAEARRSNRLKRFGITLEEYDRLFELQLGGCAICKQISGGKRLAIDHDHDTGEIRGLLCVSCNTAIGKLE